MSFSSILGKIGNFWNIVVFENTLRRIFFAIAIFVILLFVAKFLVKKLSKVLENREWKKSESFLWLITKLPFAFRILVDLFVISKILVLPAKVVVVINALFLLVVIFWVSKILIRLSWFLLSKSLQWNKASQKTLELMINIVVWVLWALIFLTNIWINLTPLVASLWVASIAVAFALQNILSDLFASFSILFSKIFIIWDFVEIWDYSGTVKSITLKSTILTNISGQEVIIPNNSVLTSNVVNYWKSKFRWQRLTLWVTYSTSVQHLKDIPWIVEWVISKIDGVEFEWCYFHKMNDYSLDFLCSYKCLTPDYQKTQQLNEKVNLWIFEEFSKNWIEFAYPSQTIYTSNN